MLPELVIVFSLPPTGLEPQQIPELFTNRESNGEYFYHVEAAAGDMSIDEPGKVNAVWTEDYVEDGLGRFEVSVNFNPRYYDFALDQLQDNARQPRLRNPGNYFDDGDRQHIGEKSATDAMAMYDTVEPVWLPIARGENWGSWMELHYRTHEDYAYMSVVYNKVDQGRVIDIRGIVYHEETTINEFIDHWQSLIDRYADIPMNRFTGAPVD